VPGCLTGAPFNSTLYNPLCGDQIALSLKVKDGKVSEIGLLDMVVQLAKLQLQ